MPISARRTAFNILKAISAGAYADVALQRNLTPDLSPSDRGLATELAYGITRRQRTLNALITQFATKPADKQPPELRWILQLGLYQLRYLTQVPQSAAIHSAVELAKELKLGGLSKVVNGILRSYQRQSKNTDPLQLPDPLVSRLGVLYSYPDWIIQVWLDQLGEVETQQLCEWMTRSPSIDLRVNLLKTSTPAMQSTLAAANIHSNTLLGLPQALRLTSHPGNMTQLPGFAQGEWMVQDASAQLVSHVLNPKPDWTVLDLCAAPGGKTLHLAELMQGQGKIWACDPTKSRLKKIQQNCDRLGMTNIVTWQGDGRALPAAMECCDAALVDVPCSGLGTLHRHADSRWRQSPDNIADLTCFQLSLLSAAASKVKPGGILVYSTCTLHPAENQQVVQQFLTDSTDWTVFPLPADHTAAQFELNDRPGLYQIWPHRSDMDGFFLARLIRQEAR